MAHSVDETIEDFDDDEATDFYFTALIVISEEFNISVNDAHLGIVDMKEEMDLIELEMPDDIELEDENDLTNDSDKSGK